MKTSSVFTCSLVRAFWLITSPIRNLLSAPFLVSTNSHFCYQMLHKVLIWYRPVEAGLEADTLRVKVSPGESAGALSISQFLSVSKKSPWFWSGCVSFSPRTDVTLPFWWYSTATSFFTQSGCVRFRNWTSTLCLSGTWKYHSMMSSSGKLSG